MIVPAYNASHYLPDCLASLDRQTDNDFECVFVDDGSTDDTASILNEYATSHYHTQVLHGPNQGLLLARRRGLCEAKGDYVVFLDSDDCLKENALEEISNCLDKTGADIVAFHSSRNADYSTEDDTTTLEAGLYEGEKYQLVKEHVCRGRFNSMWGKAFRRSSLDLNANYEPYKGLMHGEDLLQILPIVDRSGSLVQMHDTLYFYRPNEGSSTAKYRASQLRDITIVNRRLREYATVWGGGCPEAAVIGETNSYVYLLKISELSDASDQDKETAFENIRLVMETEGVFERAEGAHLRPDNKLILNALHSEKRLAARAIVIAAEKLKGKVLEVGKRSDFEHVIQRLGFR